MKALVRLRCLIAALVLLGFFILFTWGVIFPGHEKLAAFQIGPAILVGSFSFLLIMGLLTLVFGRVYCSLICPLGIFQEFLSSGKKKYRPLTNRPALRYGILAVFIASLASGLLFMYDALDPYSAFGRIATIIFGPVITGFNNLCAWASEALGSQAVAIRTLNFHGWPALVAAALTLALLLALIFRFGRIWCNYCPVGTALGLLGRKSLFRIRLDQEKCVSCGICQKACKTGCIDIKERNVDSSRCVSCLDCAAACPKGALTMMPQKKAGEAFSPPRRAFMRSLLPCAILALPATVSAAEKYRVNRPDVVPEPRHLRSRPDPITPPGSRSAEHFGRHCIGCQLCVNACPNDVLFTSTQGPGLLQPGMSYESGYCRPNCVKCGEVCPAGAIDKLSLAQKKTIRIGQAVYDPKLCIILRDQISCTACQRICPQEAIALKALTGLPENLKVPHVDTEKCTGCGACEYICPARPLAAIAVSAYAVHKGLS